MPVLSGITFIRNGIERGYPFIEAIATLATLCDEVVVAVGDSTDGTRNAIVAAGFSNVRILDTTWDDTNRSGGSELARQTNIALRNARGEWCVYLQGDEVIHEDDYALLLDEISRADRHRHVDALLFRWLHFFGSYDYVGVGRQWYRREIRAFRNTGSVISWGDAQGFRQYDARGRIRKLRARQTEVRIFHYGWVRHPSAFRAKHFALNRLYNDDAWLHAHLPHVEDFPQHCYELKQYQGTHPAVMHERIEHDRTWTAYFDPTQRPPKPPLIALSDWVEQHTGWRLGEYRNFVEVR
ncbi:MAG: glycosyltransferase family 2 protein [Chlorobi bacterium]|nr:glycosyltransferase family 2 protein [Chlorobiota bacterium]